MKILISSTVHENESPTLRNRLLDILGQREFDLVNLDGQRSFSVTDIRKTIDNHEGFIFLPIRPRKDMGVLEKDRLFQQFYLFASLFVGMQTADKGMYLEPDNLASPTKPVIVVGKSWNHFEHIMKRLHALGTLRENYGNLVSFVNSVDDVPDRLDTMLLTEGYRRQPEPKIGSLPHLSLRVARKIESGRVPPEFRVCVFCSATARNEQLTDRARHLGNLIGARGWGLITGGGSHSMMGAVVAGARESGAWTGGVQTYTISKLEQLPPLDKVWAARDIYTRISKMIEESDAFIIDAGGMGTLQEFLNVLLQKHQATPSMENKPIIIINQQITEPNTSREVSFWNSAIRIARAYGFNNAFGVANNPEEAVEMISEFRRSQRVTQSNGVAPHTVNRKTHHAISR